MFVSTGSIDRSPHDGRGSVVEFRVKVADLAAAALTVCADLA